MKVIEMKPLLRGERGGESIPSLSTTMPVGEDQESL